MRDEIGGHELRKLAVEALCDPRTCRAFLRGQRVQELSELRIRAAMERLGMRHPRRKRASEPEPVAAGS